MSIRELRYVALAIASLTVASAATAQQWSAQHSHWHSDDSRMYFDYGNPVMASVVESPDGRSADVRITTANSMFLVPSSSKFQTGIVFCRPRRHHRSGREG
ncbi:MAG: hypothetical protein ACHQNE_03890 [Candidatus Kapaibacterium sp.]